MISALAMMHGAWGVRVHDVQASVDALKVVEAWSGGLERSDRGIDSVAPQWKGERG